MKRELSKKELEEATRRIGMPVDTEFVVTPMTNDQTECLARVDEAIQYIERRRSESFQRLGSNSSENWDFHLRFLRALRTVIEKHGEHDFGDCPESLCMGEETCKTCHVPFPCQTITDIKKGLGI